MMQVIPAIDIKEGKCVRLRQGEESLQTVFSSDPVSLAAGYASAGAERIHVVDLDGAFSGSMRNGGIIKEMASALDVPLQVGGGIREFSVVEELFSIGVARVIMGTAAIYDRELLRRSLEKWPGRISVGIDSRSGKVAVQGWKETTSRKAAKLAAEMEKEGVDEIIVTDIKKDGMLSGPNLKWMKKIARRVNISVIASGGVSDIKDIENLKDLGQKNITGVIVGRALYRDDFSLEEAIKMGKK